MNHYINLNYYNKLLFQENENNVIKLNESIHKFNLLNEEKNLVEDRNNLEIEMLNIKLEILKMLIYILLYEINDKILCFR